MRKFRPKSERFTRLAGRAEIADSEFLSIDDEVAAYGRAADAQIEAAPGELPIDRETVLAYARRSPVVAEIAEFIRADSDHDQVDDITERYAGNLVRQLRYLGLRTIADVDEALARRKDLTEQFYVRWFPEIRVGDVSLGTPLFYLTWVLLSEAGDRDAAVDYLEAMNFAAGPDLPDDLARTYAAASAAVAGDGPER